MKILFLAQAIAIALMAPCAAQTAVPAAPAAPAAPVIKPIEPPIEPPMVGIPGGVFTMGHERSMVSSPAHTVTVPAFQLGKYEVTVKEFRRFIDATNYKASRMCVQMAGKKWFAPMAGNWRGNTLSSSEFHPVVCIGWDAMDAYAKWLSKETGKPYRLPTEAEWEYAHRAGSTRKFPHGNDEFEVCRYANIADRSAEAAIKRDYDGLESKTHIGVAPCDDKSDYASVVGMYEPNAFGLFDTSGNVAEFVQDCGHENYNGAPANGSAWVGGECKTRTTRGGSWHWAGWHHASRMNLPLDYVGVLEGFRLALGVDGKQAARPAAGPSAFELELAKVQQAERERRSKRAETPAS